MNNKSVSIEDIISFITSDILTIFGNTQDIFVDNVSSIENVNESTLDWINKNKTNKQNIAENSKARVILADPEIIFSDQLKNSGKVILVVESPRKILSKIITEFWLEKKHSLIHPSAIIDKEAVIDKTAFIDAGCVIGRVKIGKNTCIKANVTIEHDVIIGDNCLVQAGTVIGTDGLGCEREPDGSLIKFPHLGGIIIGNNVEIGANCQIAKGALSNTIISDGCKINGLCFIAHNCYLGKNVWITGDTMLAGSVYVGDNATIYSKVIIREQRHIGCGAVIGMGSVVVKDVPDGETWIGCPAKKISVQK